MADWLPSFLTDGPHFIAHVEGWHIYLLWVQAWVLAVVLNFGTVKTAFAMFKETGFFSFSGDSNARQIEYFGTCAIVVEKAIINLLVLTSIYFVILAMEFGL